MKHKSLGQVAYEHVTGGEYKWDWSNSLVGIYWEKVAQAVIREYLKRQKAKKKKGAKK